MRKRLSATELQSSLFAGESEVPRAHVPARQEPAVRVSAERNIEAWPLFLPSDSRAKPKVRHLTRAIRMPDGATAQASVIVSFRPELGCLTTEDQKVLYGVIRLWEQAGRPDQLTFSLRQLAKVLRRTWGTKVPQILIKSLRRLYSTPLTWVNSYHDSSQNRTLRVLEEFQIVKELKIVTVHEKSSRTSADTVTLEFHRAVLANLRNWHTKPVLFETAISFESGIALLLYRHVDLVMADKARYVRRTRELFEDLGLLLRDEKGDDGRRVAAEQEFRFLSRRKRALERAFRELDGVPLTTGVVRVALERTKDGTDYNAVFTKRARTTTRLQSVSSPRALSDEGSETRPHAIELVTHFYRVFHDHKPASFNPKELRQAAGLVRKYGREMAFHVVEYARRCSPSYPAQMFGFVLGYADRAAADFESVESSSPDMELVDCALCLGRKCITLSRPDGTRVDVGCPHDAQTIAKWQRDRNVQYVGPSEALG